MQLGQAHYGSDDVLIGKCHVNFGKFAKLKCAKFIVEILEYQTAKLKGRNRGKLANREILLT